MYFNAFVRSFLFSVMVCCSGVNSTFFGLLSKLVGVNSADLVLQMKFDSFLM